MSGVFLVLRRIQHADDAEAHVAVNLRSSIPSNTNEKNILSIRAHIDAVPCPPQHVIYMFYSYHSVNDVAFSAQEKYVGEKFSVGGDSRLIAMNDRQCSPAASMQNARRVWSKMQNFVIRSPKKFCCVAKWRAGIIATVVRIDDTRRDRGRAGQWIGKNCMTKFCQLYYSWEYLWGSDILYSGCLRPISRHYGYLLGPSQWWWQLPILSYVMPPSLVFVTSSFVALT